jgi:hypothetical protein
VYFKTAQIWKTFKIERKIGSDINSRGRQVRKYDNQEQITLRGALAEASEIDIERYKQLQHKVTHTIVQKGKPIADREDVLILELPEGKVQKFYVHDVENPGNLQSGIGSFTLYQVEERRDT